MLHSKTVAGQRACGRHGSAGRVMVLSSQGQRLVKPFQVQLVVWDGFIPPRAHNTFLTMPQTCTIYNPLPGCSDPLLSKLWCSPCCTYPAMPRTTVTSTVSSSCYSSIAAASTTAQHPAFKLQEQCACPGQQQQWCSSSSKV